MQAFKYKGYVSSGEAIEGNINAGSIEEAERRIVAQDITIIAILPASSRRQQNIDASSEVTATKGGRTLSVSDAAAILENLALMSETGVPFVEALEAAAAGARSPRVSYLLDIVKSEIIAGKSLSTALRSADGLFPPLVSDMVRVAEEGGRLDHALKTAATYLQRQAELRKRLINALMYPMVMLSISTATVLVLVLFVMPRFATIFTKMGVEVPAATRALLSVGDVLRQHPIGVVATIVAIVVGLRLALKTPAAAAVGARLVLKVPMLGDLLRKLALSRAFGSLATMLAGNVPIMAAMEHSAKVASIPEVRAAFLSARSAVEHGRTLAEALAETRVIPKNLLQMVTIGEKTGRLAPVLEATASRMEADIDARLKALVSIVEPLMIVVMGVIVGGITISIIGPIYSVVQNIK
jgi:type II secretory pathway component PulF